MSLNSEKIFAGVEHADARSLLYATGHLQENIGRKPLIGVVNTFNEIVPGHFHLRGIADAAKQGVLMAGGVPVFIPTNEEIMIARDTLDLVTTGKVRDC